MSVRITILSLALCLAATPLRAQDPASAARRKAIVEKAEKDSATLMERQTKAEKEYDDVDASLRKDLEEARGKYAAKRIEHLAALKKIESGFDAKLESIEQKKKDIQAANAKAVTGLDAELKEIQTRAAKEFSEAVSKDLLAHNDKRKATEAERKMKLAAAEEEKNRGIESYLASKTGLQETQRKELKSLDDDMQTLLAAQEKQRATAAATLAKELQTIRADRQDRETTLATELFEAVKVPGKTAPPVGAERHDLVDLAWERFDVAGSAQFDIRVDGKPIADLATAKAIQSAFAKAIASPTVLAEADGFDDTLRLIGFDSKGGMILSSVSAGGKSDAATGQLNVSFRYKLEDFETALPESAVQEFQRRIVASVVVAHSRRPWESFASINGRKVYALPVDAKGQTFPRVGNENLRSVLGTMLQARDAAKVPKGVTHVAGASFAYDGKDIFLQWEERTTDGDFRPLTDKKEIDEMNRRWEAHLARVFAGDSVPKAVRDTLVSTSIDLQGVNLQIPKAITADASCADYRFLRQGRDLLVIDKAQKKLLFRIEGLNQFSRLACAPKGGLTFAATKIHFEQAPKREWVKDLGKEVKVADLVDDEKTTSVKGGTEALFVYSGGTFRAAIVPTLGRIGSVRLQKDSYRVWFWDRNERELVSEFTLRVASDGSLAEALAGGKPNAPALSQGTEAAPKDTGGKK